MKKPDDRLWSAYLDGELSVTEVEKMEAGLTAAQLEHLRKEKVFEEKISNRLKENSSCPDQLWQSICFPKDHAQTKEIAGITVPRSIAELKKSSSTSDDLKEINRFLTKHKVSLKLLEILDDKHAQRIIGAGVEMIGNEEVVTLLFDCCGYPVKVYVLPKDSSAEKIVLDEDAKWKDGIRVQTKEGNYRLALVSKHGGNNILDAIVMT
jgi:hypothetical protein